MKHGGDVQAASGLPGKGFWDALVMAARQRDVSHLPSLIYSSSKVQRVDIVLSGVQYSMGSRISKSYS